MDDSGHYYRRTVLSGRCQADFVSAIPAALLGGSILHPHRVHPADLRRGFTLMGIGIARAVWTFGIDPLAPFPGSLLLIGIGGRLAFSVASTAILGAAPIDKAGMASSVEAVSYEFGTLIFLAVFGSLLSLFYAFTAPEEVLHDVYHGLDHPVSRTRRRQSLRRRLRKTIKITVFVSSDLADQR